MDLRMPGTDGIAATRAIRERNLGCHVVVLTVMDTDDLVHAAIGAGASGFLTKSTPAVELIELVRVAARGHGVMSADGLARLAGPRSTVDAAALTRIRTLTEREAQVLTHLGVGASNARIARALFLSEATVKGHVSRILIKLQCENRSQAALLARSGRPQP